MVNVTEEMATSSLKPIKDQRGFHSAVRVAMDLNSKIEEVDKWEKDEKARIEAEAKTKRAPLVARYDPRMDRVMAYIRNKYPEVLKGGSIDEFETEQLIVRFYRDGNGTLVIPSLPALIKYLERRRDTRKFVKVEKKLQNAASFKTWWRANPLRRPPAEIVYKHAINIVTKVSPDEKRRGKKSQTLRREIVA